MSSKDTTACHISRGLMLGVPKRTSGPGSRWAADTARCARMRVSSARSHSRRCRPACKLTV